MSLLCCVKRVFPIRAIVINLPGCDNSAMFPVRLLRKCAVSRLNCLTPCCILRHLTSTTPEHCRFVCTLTQCSRAEITENCCETRGEATCESILVYAHKFYRWHDKIWQRQLLHVFHENLNEGTLMMFHKISAGKWILLAVLVEICSFKWSDCSCVHIAAILLSIYWRYS